MTALSKLQNSQSELQSSLSELKNSSSEPQNCSSELENTSSELQNSLSELHCDIPSSAPNAAQAGPIVSRLPSPLSALHLAEEPVSVRRKRAAPVQSNSTTKRSRSGANIEEICQLLAKRSAE